MWISCVCSFAKLREQTEKVLGSAMKAIMGKTMSAVLKNDEVLEAAIAGAFTRGGEDRIDAR